MTDSELWLVEFSCSLKKTFGLIGFEEGQMSS